jgi:hypothetical protein
MEYINRILYKFNNNSYLTGVALIILNIGSKYIELGLSKTQEQAIKAVLAREILIFSMIFVSTKDVMLSIIVTASFVVLTNFLLNENSKFCIAKGFMRRVSVAMDINDDNVITEEEENRAIRLLEKAKKQKRKQQQYKFASYLPFQEVNNLI